MQNTWSIGRTWKPRKGWSRPVLTGKHDTQPTIRWWEGITTAKTARNTRDTEQRSVTAERQTSVHHPVPNPPTTGKPTGSPTTQDLRRPWPRGDARTPFRTRKLRPGTAMVLHPTGRGRVARRRTTRTRNPRSSHTAPGGPLIPEPTRTENHHRCDHPPTPPANRRKQPGHRRGNQREKTLSHGAGDTTQGDRGGQHVGITRIRRIPSGRVRGALQPVAHRVRMHIERARRRLQ